jgi:hypothetical protein
MIRVVELIECLGNGRIGKPLTAMGPARADLEQLALGKLKARLKRAGP